MKQSRCFVTLLAVAIAASVALPHAALAQTRAPSSPAATATAARTPIHTSGTLSHYVLSPLGRVRALMLNGGTMVFVHGRAAQRMPRSIAVGTVLDVQGYTVAGQRSTIHGATVRDADGQVLVAAPIERPNASARPNANRRARLDRLRAARRERIAQLPNVSATGTVQAVLTDRRGTIGGIVLTDGTSIAVGRRLARQLRAHGVRTGDTLHVAGHGTNYPAGESMQAAEVTFSDGTSVRVPV